MDKTFIKTSVGIIRIEHISYITEYKFAATGDDIIMIHFTNGDDISLAGKEARSFLQFIPIAADITYLAKEESGVEIAGLKM